MHILITEMARLNQKLSLSSSGFCFFFPPFYFCLILTQCIMYHSKTQGFPCQDITQVSPRERKY